MDGAIALAGAIGVSDALIGSTIVAIGTSLPELAASVVAARKGKVDMAVGNVVGSKLFNILWILGIGAILTPITLNEETLLDIYISIGAALVLFGAMVFGRHRHQISNFEGKIFLSLYALYLVIATLSGYDIISLTG